jgi:hypothetical protein
MGLVQLIEGIKRKRENKKTAQDLVDRAEKCFHAREYGCRNKDSVDYNPCHDQEIYEARDFSSDGNKVRAGGPYVWWGNIPNKNITKDFIYKCLDDGLGIKEFDEQELDFIMTVGLAVSARDYSRACAIMFHPFPGSVTDKSIKEEDLPQMALSLVRLHRATELNPNAEIGEYYSKLVRMYDEAADKFSRVNFGG